MSRTPPAFAANDKGQPVAGAFSRLTAYDLMAATVVVMVLGHIVSYFNVPDLWWRVPDRILWPAFFVPLGYNVGRRLDPMLLLWAGAIIAAKLMLFSAPLLPLPILVTIAFVRLALEPLMQLCSKGAWTFWGVVAVLAALAPFSNNFAEGGLLALLLAMGGWLLRNRGEIPLSISPRVFFVALFVYYNCYSHFMFFSAAPPVQLALVLAGNALVFWLLYGWRDRVLASVRRRPKDVVEKICSFIGHKSLEIYALHILLFYVILFYALR